VDAFGEYVPELNCMFEGFACRELMYQQMCIESGIACFTEES
jgi:hypothetical protein